MVENYLNKEVKKWVKEHTDEELAHLIELGYYSQKTSRRLEQSTLKGQIGEDHIYNSLKPYFKIQSTGKIAKSGDFQIITEFGKIMVEVKNYNNTVGQKEIDKFHRDLSQNNDVKAGLFISLHSPIVGIKETIQFEEELIHSRKIPIVYIQEFTPEVIRLIVDLLIYHIKRERFGIINTMNYITQLSTDLTNLSKARIFISEMRTSINKGFDDLHSMLSSAEINLTRTVDDMQNKIEWKRLIPHENFSDLWEFVRNNFKITEDDRIVPIKYTKMALMELYEFVGLDWYYSKDHLSTGDYKLWIDSDSEGCRFEYQIRKNGKNKTKVVRIDKDTFDQISVALLTPELVASS